MKFNALRISLEVFDLLTRSVTSFCVTRFCYSRLLNLNFDCRIFNFEVRFFSLLQGFSILILNFLNFFSVFRPYTSAVRRHFNFLERFSNLMTIAYRRLHVCDISIKLFHSVLLIGNGLIFG